MTVVRGARVTLRAFRPEEIDGAIQRIGGGIEPSDNAQAVRRRERLRASGDRNDWEVLFAVEADNRLVGDAQGRCSEHAMPPGVWEIGIELWDPADRGKGFGREAVALLSSHMFERESAIRVQATTDVVNSPMRRILESLGFGFEGVLRGFMPTGDGTARDYAMYGFTRDDWTTRRNEGVWELTARVRTRDR
jgi:RimJ/RimL family protein N-acetyltransferase